MRLQISSGFHALLGDDIYAVNSCYLYRMPAAEKQQLICPIYNGTLVFRDAMRCVPPRRASRAGEGR